MEFIGKVTHRSATRLVGNNQSPTFNFMLEELNPRNPQYPQNCVLSAWGDKCKDIEPFIKKDAVLKAFFDFGGREYNGNLYGENKCWKVETYNGEQTAPQTEITPTNQQQAAVPKETPRDNQSVQKQGDNLGGSEENSDLPF